jgi:glycosyltransferase involved in cell wall biosynthesis
VDVFERRAAAEHVAGRVFGAASALIGVSGGVADYLATFSTARGRIHVVPNGVNPHRFPAGLSPALPARPGAFTVGFAGSLKPWHGLSILAEAFVRLHRWAPESRLLIVGDGPERARVAEYLAAANVLPAVDFTGAVSPEEVPGLLAAMDVATAPYPDQPGFYFSPLKVYEYMAAGRAVAASRIGQIEQVLRHGEDGLLCPPGDAALLDRIRVGGRICWATWGPRGDPLVGQGPGQRT